MGTNRVGTNRVGTVRVGTIRAGTISMGTIRVGTIRVGTVGHICAIFATCSWELLIMLNPHFVAEEQGLFWRP